MRTALLFALLLALFGFAYAQQVAIEPNASPPVCSMTAVYKAGRAVSILNDKTGEVEAAFDSNSGAAYPDPDRVCICRDRFMANIGKFCPQSNPIYQYWNKLCYESGETYDEKRCRTN